MSCPVCRAVEHYDGNANGQERPVETTVLVDGVPEHRRVGKAVVCCRCQTPYYIASTESSGVIEWKKPEKPSAPMGPLPPVEAPNMRRTPRAMVLDEEP